MAVKRKTVWIAEEFLITQTELVQKLKQLKPERDVKIRQLQNEVADLKKQLKPDEPRAVEQKEKV
jgi:hypothetical protein